MCYCFKFKHYLLEDSTNCLIACDLIILKGPLISIYLDMYTAETIFVLDVIDKSRLFRLKGRFQG